MPVQDPFHGPAYSNEDDHDLLPWTACFEIDVYGLRIDIRTNDSSLLKRLPAHLPFGWGPPKTTRVDRLYSLGAAKKSDASPSYALRQGEHLLTVTSVLEEALQVLEYDLELHVAESAPRHVFVHAGVVGWRGGAILIPGRSFSGKSSLVAALCHCGAIYYSDEFAILDLQGRVHPYRRPLHLRQAIPHVPLPRPENPEKSATLGSLPISLVVLTYFQTAAHWNPQPLSSGRAILHLMENTMCSQRRPQAVLSVLNRSLRSACVIQGPRGEARATAQHLLTLASGYGTTAEIGTLGTRDPDPAWLAAHTHERLQLEHPI